MPLRLPVQLSCPTCERISVASVTFTSQIFGLEHPAFASVTVPHNYHTQPNPNGKVEPENSKVSDLKGDETRQMVRCNSDTHPDIMPTTNRNNLWLYLNISPLIYLPCQVEKMMYDQRQVALKAKGSCVVSLYF